MITLISSILNVQRPLKETELNPKRIQSKEHCVHVRIDTRMILAICVADRKKAK